VEEVMKEHRLVFVVHSEEVAETLETFAQKLDRLVKAIPSTLIVHEGRIRFSAADKDVEAEAGTVIACDAGVRHSVEAFDDAVCLLNVAMGSER
jgi:hypothetical protein